MLREDLTGPIPSTRDGIFATISTDPMRDNDHFSPFAATYAQFRPTYPAELYAWLADQCPHRRHAWDCATGNGQAAQGLAAHFEHMTATDLSAEMIAHAAPHPRITYEVASAETPPPRLVELDLITVAMALHWFDREKFWTVCQDRLRPGGVLAYWGYLLPHVSTAVDVIVALYHDIKVGPYWPPGRGPLLNGYADLNPPGLQRIEAPEFDMKVTWSLDQFIGMLESWSATQRSRQAQGIDPLAEIRPELEATWGPAPRRVRWPLAVHAWRHA